MKKILLIAGLLIMGGAAAALAMGDFIIPKTWNYKITIEVETPEGMKSGSAVRQIQARQELAGYINPGGGIVTYDVIGEAVIVDLGKYGLLFGLIQDADYLMLENAFNRKSGNPIDNINYFANLRHGTKKELKTNLIPFVTFTDPRNPKTIKGAGSRAMSEVFGENVVFHRMIIEITDQPVTWGQVRKYLSWYDTGKMGLGFEEIKKLRFEKNRNTDSAKFYTKETLIRGER